MGQHRPMPGSAAYEALLLIRKAKTEDEAVEVLSDLIDHIVSVVMQDTLLNVVPEMIATGQLRIVSLTNGQEGVLTHEHSEGEETVFRCSGCRAKFKTVEELTAHAASHIDERTTLRRRDH